ncbi:MAG: endonuclease III domain-containing protein [Candidatus Omnitrophota bacterium]
MTNKLISSYKKLYSHFGPQYWWPAKSSFEVMIGAILTQNTNWGNVEKAINNLHENKLLSAVKLNKLSCRQIGKFITPAGYYNVKAKRIKEFLKFLFKVYKGDINKMLSVDTSVLRGQLLSVHGIGPETADSILLYALNKPVFVIDAYTKRMLSRHSFVNQDVSYEQAQELFMKALRPDVKLFNEYHALLVKLAKDYCLKNKPKCDLCPLYKL